MDAIGVTKSFGALRALTDASLHVARGEVAVLTGAHGAGTSMFVKILTGAFQSDTGRVLIAAGCLQDCQRFVTSTGTLILRVIDTMLALLQMPEGARIVPFGLIILLVTALYVRITGAH